MKALIQGYDAALFDLDGVIYLGPDAVPGAPAALGKLGDFGAKTMFVTNNAARDASTVIDHLKELGFHADTDNVLTSAQVAAVGLEAQLPAGARVLVAGTRSLTDLLIDSGFQVVTKASEHPVAVIQGYDPELEWGTLDEVSLAIQAGARWYATNDDISRPTDRGMVPGVGGAVAVIRLVVGGEPIIFGKPFMPMLAEAVRRTGAAHPVFVGDRLDTDVGGANNACMDSLLVFSGAHGKRDLIKAPVEQRPTHIGADVSALLLPPRTVIVERSTATCGTQRAEAGERHLRVSSAPRTYEEQLDALWALVHLAWREPTLDPEDALAGLRLIP